MFSSWSINYDLQRVPHYFNLHNNVDLEIKMMHSAEIKQFQVAAAVVTLLDGVLYE